MKALCEHTGQPTCMACVWVGEQIKATIHQVTTMLVTSKNVLFPGHDHLLTTSTNDSSLGLSPEHQQVKGLSTGG